MDRRSTLPANVRKRRRRMTVLWSAVVAAIVITLLMMGRIELLYLLSTLSVTVLLIIVARADLGDSRRTTNEPAPLDDAAAIADRTGAQYTTFGSTAARTKKSR